MIFKKNKKDLGGDDKISVDVSLITTIIGKDTVFEGTLTSDSSVRINGTVIGDVKVQGIVILSVTGRIEGTVEAESIIVAGKIEGNMSIRDKVNVEPTGQIYGEIITKKFVIDEESVFEGNCIMNRDGKVIPAKPYKNKDEEAEKPETDKAEKSDDSDKEEKPEEKSEEKNEEKPDLSETDSGESEESEKDSDIIIKDINEIENDEDEPTTDDYIDSAEVKEGNFRKTSKSLSVEVEK